MECLSCSIKDWIDDPLPYHATALDWFLYAGLMICAGIAWKLILHDLLLE
jgi:hypothetical protein